MEQSKRPSGTSASLAAAPMRGGSEAPGGSFGRILLDLRLLSEAQLLRALEVQRERSRRGDFARLGHILVEQGFLTPEQVQQALTAQAIQILSCVDCNSQFNIRGWSADQAYACSKCHGNLKPAQKLTSVAVQDQLDGGNLDDTAKIVAAPVVDSSNTAKIRQLKQLGKYEILGEIARGGMGIIYKARQMDLDRVVALKTLRREELTKPDAAGRFRTEAQALAQLRHPNIIAVHEVGAHEGIEYFTMQFVEGLPLDRHLLRERLSPSRAAEVVLAIADALEYAHRQNVVHRDLKPGNIIIDPEGEPFLVDFGIAKRLTKRLERDDEEDLLGSIPYMAPEYVEGAAYDELCDLYSLGVVLYEALAGPGCLPHYDDDTRRFLEKIMQEPPCPIRARLPDLDPDLSGIVDRMTARRPQRHQSMKEVVLDLRRWLVQKGSQAPTPARGMPAAPPPVAAPAAPTSTTPAAGTPSPPLASQPGVVSSRPSGRLPSLQRAPAPHAVRTPSLLGALSLALGIGLALTLVALQGAYTRQEIADREHAERTLRYEDDLCRAHLDYARKLRDLDRAQEAIDACTRGLVQLDGPGREGSWPLLGDLFRLRGQLRQRAGQQGADDDLRRATALGSSAQ